jgi:predicted RNA binding protein YcfA (HicA-like mRNA interferase family)
VPRKIRRLKTDLRKAGFVLLPGRGKGSHTTWDHPNLARKIVLAGHDGADAKPYQEQEVRDAILESRRNATE